MDRDKLLKEIQAIEINLSYYKRDLRKFYKRLKTEFDINPDSVGKRIEQIDKKKNRLDLKEENIERKIKIKLKGIKDGRHYSRI